MTNGQLRATFSRPKMLPVSFPGFDRYRFINEVFKYFDLRGEDMKSNIRDWDCIFVGDCHGDLYQFLAPLILTGFAKFRDYEIEDKYMKGTRIVPFDDKAREDIRSNLDLELTPEIEYLFKVPFIHLEYDPAALKNRRIIYLGDYIDRGIASTTILLLIQDIKKRTDVDIEFLIGNHEAFAINILNRIYEENKPLHEKLLTYQNMLYTFLSNYRKFEQKNNNPIITLHGDTIMYNGDRKKGIELVMSTYKPIVKLISSFIGKKYFKLFSHYHEFLVSHNVTTRNMLRIFSSRTIIPIDSLIENMTDVDINSSKFIEYLSWMLNYAFYRMPIGDLIASGLLIQRTVEGCPFNMIVGHTVGGSKKMLRFNDIESYSNEDRWKHLVPYIPPGQTNKIYFFDFGVTFAEDEYNYSKPDFVMFKDGKPVGISQLDAIHMSDDISKTARIALNKEQVELVPLKQ